MPRCFVMQPQIQDVSQFPRIQKWIEKSDAECGVSSWGHVEPARSSSSLGKLQQSRKGRSFYLWLGLFYLRLVFVAHGNWAWSFLLTFEIQFGLVCLRWKICLIFLLAVPLVRKLDCFFCLGSPTVSKQKVSEKTSIAK